MVDPVETAQDQIGEAHEERGEATIARINGRRRFISRRRLAIVDLARSLPRPNTFTRNISASDTWNAYQAENLRASLWNAEASLLESLANASDPAVQERIKKSHSEEARMRDEPASGDGMKQLREKAKALEEEREKAFHSYHRLRTQPRASWKSLSSWLRFRRHPGPRTWASWRVSSGCWLRLRTGGARSFRLTRRWLPPSREADGQVTGAGFSRIIRVRNGSNHPCPRLCRFVPTSRVREQLAGGGTVQWRVFGGMSPCRRRHFLHLLALELHAASA